MLAIVLLLSGAYAAEDFPAEAGYAPGGERACVMCHMPDDEHPLAAIRHTPHGMSGDPRSPAAGLQCQSCHGPSAAHLEVKDGVRPQTAVPFDQDTPAKTANRACLDCHDDYSQRHWHGSGHEFAEVTCADCHQSHTAVDPMMRPGPAREAVCLECHSNVRSEIHRPSTHPMRAGQMSCMDCHAAHGSPSEGELVAASLNETCYGCHAEFRGPVLWEHPPVRESCSNCHEPHGSVHDNLLKTRAPQLCQQCHSAAFHPSTAPDGSGVPPQGASASMLQRNCMNCHTDVHGSNHPSGAGQTR
ncbi:DmsE family decaheme c-type cytochrome [Gammaproteobacteria bacterium AB-CW1]|uniref:DmsE family decaheme c-type cytochrome n=3 Tax=Natronospira TaxID=2024969 RepID=A0AAP6JD07_9GAMM|nr:DmsE family decaheme c-type cytochrome [Gammaproteobacteria bacterium AB-CW1]